MLKHVLAKPLCAGAAVVLLLAPLPALGKGIQVSKFRKSEDQEICGPTKKNWQLSRDQVVP